MKKEKISKKQIALLSLIVILFLIFNISLFEQYGHYLDLNTTRGWCEKAYHEGLANMYLKGLTIYAPLYQYVFKFDGWILFKLYANQESTQEFMLISKFIPMLCNLIIGLLLFFYLRKRGFKTAMIGMSLYLFNLAVIYNTSVWGQFEAANTIFMFLSIIFLIEERYAFSLISITFAVLTKLQSAPLVPIVVVIIFLNCDYKRIAKIILADIIAVFIILFPFIIGGAAMNIFQNYFHFIDWDKLVSINAYNFWFLFSPKLPLVWQSALSDQTKFLGLTLKSIGLLMLSIYTLLVMYQLSKNRTKENIILAAASMTFAFFMLPTQIRERYLFYMHPFLALLAMISKNKKYLIIYFILLITDLLTLMIVLPFSGSDPLFNLIQLVINIPMKIFPIGFVFSLAVINVLTFIYFNKIGILNNLFKNIKEDLIKMKNWRKKGK